MLEQNVLRRTSRHLQNRVYSGRRVQKVLLHPEYIWSISIIWSNFHNSMLGQDEMYLKFQLVKASLSILPYVS